jgi:hypothetical protein
LCRAIEAKKKQPSDQRRRSEKVIGVAQKKKTEKKRCATELYRSDTIMKMA